MCIEPPKNLDSGKSCFDCKHFKTHYEDDTISIDDYPNCLAFPYPERIPTEVYNNGHEKPRPDLGQKNDIVFTKGED